MSTITIPRDNELVSHAAGFSLRLERSPDAIIAEARLCADALMAAVRRNHWVQQFGNKEHLFFEAWGFLANMYKVAARVKETRLVQIGEVTGYEAFAEAVHWPSGIILSAADSMCLDDEDNWDTRPEYDWVGEGTNRKKKLVGEKTVPLFQLRSMAQTRAMAKSLRSPFSWIIAMAGYGPRAAEEMTGNERSENGAGKPPATPQQKPVDGRVISEAQAKRIWGIAYTLKIDRSVVGEILTGYGFSDAASVTTDKYDAICAAIEKSGEEAARK